MPHPSASPAPLPDSIRQQLQRYPSAEHATRKLLHLKNALSGDPGVAPPLVSTPPTERGRRRHPVQRVSSEPPGQRPSKA